MALSGLTIPPRKRTVTKITRAVDEIAYNIIITDEAPNHLCTGRRRDQYRRQERELRVHFPQGTAVEDN